MNYIKKTVSAIISWKHDSKYRDYYEGIKNKQWNPIEENINYQKNILYNIISYSFKNIEYYKELNIDISSFSKETIFEDVNKLPILTKKTLRKQSNKISKPIPSLKSYRNTSGGSTGEPVNIIQDKYYKDWNFATVALNENWSQKSHGSRMIILWGSEKDIMNQKNSFKIRMSNWAMEKKLLNTFRMGEADMKEYIEEINNYKPKIIKAYVSSIYELARFAQLKGMKVYSPSAIITSAGMLYPEYRELIQSVFNCPVFNHYGSREVGPIACECEKHEGLHLNIFNNYVEIVDGNGNLCGPGEPGEILVTTLRNYSMPLIRYRIGDIGELSEEGCSCNRGMPILKKVIGRTNSMIRTKDTCVDSAAITSLLYYYSENKLFESFSKYQIVQKTKGSIEMKVVVTDASLWQKEKIKIKEKFNRVFGQGVSFMIKEVDLIEPSKSGKHMYIISEI